VCAVSPAWLEATFVAPAAPVRQACCGSRAAGGGGLRGAVPVAIAVLPLDQASLSRHPDEHALPRALRQARHHIARQPDDVEDGGQGMEARETAAADRARCAHHDQRRSTTINEPNRVTDAHELTESPDRRQAAAIRRRALNDGRRCAACATGGCFTWPRGSIPRSPSQYTMRDCPSSICPIITDRGHAGQRADPTIHFMVLSHQIACSRWRARAPRRARRSSAPLLCAATDTAPPHHHHRRTTM